MPKGSEEKVGTDTELVAYRVFYAGPSAYPKAFEGTGFGVVLDDDDETCYFYATTEDFEEVLDGLHLYNSNWPDKLTSKDEIYIIWNPEFLKAGLYYRGAFQAIFDFKEAKACCRTGFPTAEPSGWCTSSHHYDPKMETGLTFNRVGE